MFRVQPCDRGLVPHAGKVRQFLHTLLLRLFRDVYPYQTCAGFP